jgi:hypothetical protein
MIERMNDSMYVWMNKCINEQINDSKSEWQINEWINI